MSDDKLRRMEELYDKKTANAQTDKPKRGLIGWKCPKCGGKLTRESLKETIFSGEGGSDFARRAVTEAGQVPEGIHELTMHHFDCKCGYEFISADIQPMREDV